MLAKRIFSGLPSHFTAGIMLLVLTLAPMSVVMAGPNDLVGGDEVIPINPDYSPTVQLQVTGGTLPVDESFAAQLTGAANISRAASTANVLSAALSQSLSAANRPSVLTPYAGILKWSEGEIVYDTFGSIIANKANTIGKGKLGIGISYQYAEFNEFDGEDIGKLADGTVSATGNVNLGGTEIIPGVAIERDANISRTVELKARDVEFEADVITLALTYGLLENLDIGALVPYIFLTTRGKIIAEVTESGSGRFGIFNTTTGDPIEGTVFLNVDAFTGSVDDEEKFDRDFDGIGDIILFTKWQILSQQGLPKRVEAPLDMALQLEVKLPTGDDEEFLGTGETDVALRVLLQRMVSQNIIARGEIGYNYSGINSEFSTVEAKLGGEYQITPKVSVSGEFIYSYSEEFESIIDAVVGTKLAITRDFRVFGGVRFPLNDNGLRYDWSPIVGMEYTFSPRVRSDSIEEMPDEMPEEMPDEMPGVEPGEDTARSGGLDVQVATLPRTETPVGASGQSAGLRLMPTASKTFVVSSIDHGQRAVAEGHQSLTEATTALPMPAGSR